MVQIAADLQPVRIDEKEVMVRRKRVVSAQRCLSRTYHTSLPQVIQNRSSSAVVLHQESEAVDPAEAERGRTVVPYPPESSPRRRTGCV